MMNLAEYRSKAQRLADFLPWAALVRKGVVLNKDGSFQRTTKFRGPDLDSATPAELVAITARLTHLTGTLFGRRRRHITGSDRLYRHIGRPQTRLPQSTRRPSDPKSRPDYGALDTL